MFCVFIIKILDLGLVDSAHNNWDQATAATTKRYYKLNAVIFHL